MCALVYQTVWLRELRLIFGASTAASAAVLAIFMGGLGVGSALLGKVAERRPRPLFFYAHLELAIAASAALTPLLLYLARAAYLAVGGTPSLGLFGGTVARLLLSALVLALPTALMGGSLPAAALAASEESDQGRRSVAVLYGLNTLGAVAGAAGSTFFVLEAFGSRNTLYLACLVNALVAIVARVVARRSEAEVPASPAEPKAEEGSPPALAPAWFVFAASGAVGFVFLLMELVWYRMLAPLLGGSTFTFGLILAVALLGIALGGGAYAFLARQRMPTVRTFALSCALEAALVALPLALGDRLAVWALLLRSLGAVGFGGLLVSWTAIAFLVVFPPAVVAGAQFPLLIALLGRGRKHLGRQVGLAYASNTLGAILGSLAGGFGLLPALTAPGAWRLSVALLLAISVGALAFARREGGALRLAGTLAAVTLSVAMLFARGPTSAWRHGAVGAGRAVPPRTATEVERWFRERRHNTVWESEGVESSLALVKGHGLSFLVNGKSDGNSILDAPTQVMGGLMAALLHPAPKRAMVIGLGTGSTAGWLAAVPGIERVDVAEIEPDILEVARRCAAVNHGAMENPKVHLQLGDAREILLTSRERYDVILSEPSNPYRAGIASLYTRDYYRAVKQRLSQGGIFVQWLQAYEVDAQTVRAALSTVASEFPSVEVWHTSRSDMLLVAEEARATRDADQMRRRMAEEPFRKALLATWRVDGLEGFLSHFVAGPELVDSLASAELVNTDDLNHIEFGFARNVGRSAGFHSDELLGLAKQRKADRPALSGAVDWSRFELERMLAGLGLGSSPRSMGLPKEGPLRPRFELYSRYRAGDLATPARAFRESRWEPQGPVELLVVADLLASSADEEALGYLERLRPLLPVDADLLLGTLRLGQGRHDAAADALLAAFASHRENPWASGWVVSRSLRAAVSIAEKKPELGRRLYQALSEPFAAMASDEDRLKARVYIAKAVGDDLCASALAPFEPDAPWHRTLLAYRVKCYQQQGSPLLAAAQADLDAFIEEQPIPISASLLAADGQLEEMAPVSSDAQSRGRE
ncbi:MAG: fused MFS/spermidine synthase [Myxococcales bacterium]|nr:fused MFS/spermidine synthase [Myxococcales bacterium]